jgi:hypothetical protein
MIVITLDSTSVVAIVLLFLICWLHRFIDSQRCRESTHRTYQSSKKRSHRKKIAKHTHIHLT